MFRPWAFWRRVQYAIGLGVFFSVCLALVYTSYLYETPTCFDGKDNGQERGVDCGGLCTRICAIDILPPEVTWARSFRVADGQYNAVAYVENKNRIAATPEVAYTFSLYDKDGLITERIGTTILPPDSVYPIFEDRIYTQGRVPTQTFITLAEADVWLPATVGRNQFTVTERKLSDVDAKPRLDVKIRNNALTPADEVEIVATIFDAKGNALTSSRTFVDNFAPRSETNAVFTWPEPIAKTVRSCEVPTDVVLAIDLSGSMNNDSNNPPQPLTSVLTAAKAFVDRLRDSDQVSLVTFATDAVVKYPLTQQLGDVARTVAKLSIDPKEETGSTNTGEAFTRALEEFGSNRHSIQSRKVLVLLTDGLATAPDENPEEFAQKSAQAVKSKGVTIFTIGLGEQVNMDFIKTLASAPTQAYQALSVVDVDRIYRVITASLCEDGAAVIDVVPKTDASFAPLQ